MGNNQIYICPKCKSWFAVSKKNQEPTCPDCNIDLKCTNVSEEQFESMSDADKTILENKIFTKQKFKYKSYNNKLGKKEQSDSSLWITLMETVCIIVLCLFILFGIFSIVAGGFVPGIIIFAASTLLGLVLISGTMVFTGMARDLRAIRNMFENYKDQQLRSLYHWNISLYDA